MHIDTFKELNSGSLVFSARPSQSIPRLSIAAALNANFSACVRIRYLFFAMKQRNAVTWEGGTKSFGKVGYVLSHRTCGRTGWLQWLALRPCGLSFHFVRIFLAFCIFVIGEIVHLAEANIYVIYGRTSVRSASPSIHMCGHIGWWDFIYGALS